MKHVILSSIFLLYSLLCFSQYAIETNFGYSDEPYAFDAIGGVDYWYDSTTGANDMVYFTGWTNEPATRMVIGSMDANGEFNLNYAPNYNRVWAPAGTTSSNGYEIEMQSSDRPVVGGICIMQDADVSSLFMGRFTSGGNVDTTFGDLGYFFYAPEGQDCYLGEIIVSPTDEIYMLGRVRAAGFGDYSHLVIKLTADGQLDESFADDGILVFNTSSSNSYLSGGLLLENGQLLVAGRANGSVKIFRINSDGTPDLEFGVNEEEGEVEDGEIETTGLSEILAIKQYGDWFYAFSTGTGAGSYIYKFNDMDLDEDYGINGEMDLEFDGFHSDAWFTEEGKVVFTGSFLGVSYVTRADTSGVLDSGFFEGGQNSFEIFENNAALFSSTLLSDESIITSGQAIDLFNSSSGQDFVAYKLTENGMTDNISERKNNNIKTYPNPFTTEFLIESELPITGITLYDFSGRKVYEAEPKTPSISLTDMNVPAGYYSLHIRTSEGMQRMKVVKL